MTGGKEKSEEEASYDSIRQLHLRGSAIHFISFPATPTKENAPTEIIYKPTPISSNFPPPKSHHIVVKLVNWDVPFRLTRHYNPNHKTKMSTKFSGQKR
jgi:hypothetical protein